MAEVGTPRGNSSLNSTYWTYYKWLLKESSSDIDELDGKYDTKNANKRNL